MIPIRHQEQTYSLAVEQHEDGFLGYFPALPGCRTWGATYDAAVKAARDALIHHLQTVPAHGDHAPEEKGLFSRGAAMLVSAFSVRMIHLHTITTATAMVTCTAIILNLGPFGRSPTIDHLLPDPGAAVVLEQSNNGGKLESESGHISSEPIGASLQPPSISVVAVTPIVTAPLGEQRKVGTDDGAVTEMRQSRGLADAAVQAENVASSEDIRNDLIMGIWSPEGSACSARDFERGMLPTVISADGAWAGDTFCIFKKKQRTQAGWRIVAECSNPREHWRSNVRLSVNHNRLSWASQRGTQVYARCATDVLMAQPGSAARRSSDPRFGT
jgi:predicted RNase H-like HicB family nuclease